MFEFFNHKSNLTSEPAMVKVNNEYLPLADVLSSNTINRIIALLMNNNKSRAIIIKMHEFGITSDVAIIRNFIRCNWDALERLPDISDDNHLNFEYVNCGYKGANHKCPHSVPGDPKPFCIIKSLYNIPYNEHNTGNKHHN